MFRHLRPRRRPTSPVREALKRIQNDYQQKQQQATVNDIHPQLTRYKSLFSRIAYFVSLQVISSIQIRFFPVPN